MLSQFNKGQLQTSITHHGCHGGVVAVRHEGCEEAVSFVSYSQADNTFLISSFGVHPLATAKEAQLAGDLIDAALELEAMKHGVKQLLIVHPSSSTAEFVRDYQVKPFVMGVGVKTNTPVYVN